MMKRAKYFVDKSSIKVYNVFANKLEFVMFLSEKR